MEIRVLGSVDVLLPEGGAASLGAGERELMAVLALSAGRVVPVSTLVDALWGEDLPANPINALQVRISKLRRALERIGAAHLLVTRPPGYLLDIGPERVDALRFTRLVANARVVAATDATAGAEAYREALALWHGFPVGEFAGSGWADAEARRLTDVQVTAREELIDLELAAGRHAETLDELEALTVAYPLRERLHGQLMLALYRAGRQADALAAYERARGLLDTELGLAPSPELRGLQQAILQQRPGLRAPQRMAPAPPPPPPVRHLPPRLTSFRGREEDLARLGSLVREHRLVTVLGPGGVGKTSLALEAARVTADLSPDGVGFARLSGITDPDQVARAVLTAFDVRDVATATAEDQLLGHLRDRAVLVVLDNCEHLVDACALLTEGLLETCPRVRILATSREPLAAGGEVQFSIDPLGLPPASAAPEELLSSAAVQLFVDRAAAALPGFILDRDSGPAVADICRHLDGIPLAIELAAARVPVLPVRELAGRMEDRFALLTSGRRTAEARQRTLRATVDWSHDLLTEPERVLLRRLSVFAATFSLDAVHAVASGDGLDPRAAVDTLARLVERSLVVADRDTGPRYHLLETVREYARERLENAGEIERTAWAHVAYFTDLAERAETELRGDGQARWLPRLAAERDDLEAALAWSTAHATARPDAGLWLVGALGWYWYFASRPDGGAKVAAMLEAAPGGSPPARARALQSLAVAARPGACIVHPAAGCADAAAESRSLFEELGDEFRAAVSTTLLAVEAIGGSDRQIAFDSLDDADREFRKDGDRWCSALVEFVRMELHATAGAMDDAITSGDQALAAFRALGDQWAVSAIQFHLGMALHRAGQLDAARALYEGALSTGRAVGPANTIQYALAGAGHVALLLGEEDRAERLFADSHAVAHDLGATGNPRAAVGEGLLARRRGDISLARTHLERALEMLTRLGEPEWTATALVGLGHVAELSGDLDRAASAHQRAWATNPGHAAALEGLACVTAARGDALGAARLLGAAASWRAKRHRPISRLEQVDADRAAQRARSLLGDRSFDTERQFGTDQPDSVMEMLAAVSG
jgi:predicted ATPase/DNA-binding SARP family transcriptional activator